jgi:hypothetical protein
MIPGLVRGSFICHCSKVVDRPFSANQQRASQAAKKKNGARSRKTSRSGKLNYQTILGMYDENN